MSEITIVDLKSVLFYDPKTGHWGWIAKRSKHASRRKSGQKAGFITTGGYVGIQVFGKRYLAHRLAWFYMTGEWPEHTVDHINFIRCDNRWENLQDITQAKNSGKKNMKKCSLQEHREKGRLRYPKKNNAEFSTYGGLQDPANPKYKRHRLW